MLLELVKTGDRKSFFISDRITVRCKYHTDCCIVFKLKIYLIQCSVDTGFDHIDQIIFHTRKNNLCLRISESGIVFQNLRSVFGKHQSEEDDPLELSSLCCHCIYRLLVHIFPAEFINFFCIERTR